MSVADLSADQLAEKVQAVFPDTAEGYYSTTRDWKESVAALAELVRRASERDQAVRERDEAVKWGNIRMEECEAAEELTEQRADRLAAALKRSLIQHLDSALTLAESDPLFMEILRPYFHRIADALSASQETP